MRIQGLQYITHEIEDFSHEDQALEALEGGCEWIQLRFKTTPEADRKEIAEEVFELCGMFDAKLIINDDVNLAKEIGADGVHLGKEDMSIEEARAILGEEAIIGGTANNIEDIIELNHLGVQYIGLGPYAQTSTKKKLEKILGLKGYSHCLEMMKGLNISLPIIAVGGIGLQDVKDLFDTGIDGAAVSSSLHKSRSNMRNSTMVLAREINKYCHE
ncbi:MAG: thiamine-phosphate pyrophosphorylase [Candidatus Azotimanducaceae bacterium]|jgi:thiamine-phosphate pyrophosphorylase